jgi:pimeloyl-ACP methyl ester carboxylesterase
MQTQFLKREQGRIAYEVTGSGPPVIGVPSMGDLRGEYRFLAPRLAAAGYQVATMDVRGHGESDTGWSDYSVAGVGSDIVALIRALGTDPAFVIGDSMAAGASVWAAAEAPESVRGMVLMGPFVRDIGSNPLMETLYGILFGDLLGPTMWGLYYNQLYPTRKPADFAEYLSRLKRNLREPGRMQALRAMLAAPKAASAERIGRVAKPAMILMGSRDPDFKAPETEARWVAEQLKGSYHMIDGAGHYPHAEMTDAVAPLILSFLNSSGSGL